MVMRTGAWPCITIMLVLVSLEVGLGVGVEAQLGNDRNCLNALLSSLRNPGLLAGNWTGSSFPCASPFLGIKCEPASQRVWALRMGNFGLAGTLSPGLADCSVLTELDLSANLFSGTIPSDLGRLTALVSLILSENSLVGSIPTELAGLTALEALDLSGNNLTGSIPPDLGSLDKLNFFSVVGNSLSGQIPKYLAKTPSGRTRFNLSSFRPGNPLLHGAPLPQPGGAQLSALSIVFIGLASGLLSFVVSFAAVCVWLRWAHDNLSISHDGTFKSLPENV